jgi:hypothetical protein
MATNTPAPEIARAESIALLHLLHPVPALPSRNSINSEQIRLGCYTLSFETELRLAGTLAFLSSITDDPDYIPALCVEEDPQSASLNVLLSVNKANQNDGNEVLQPIKQGFEQIFAVLSRLLDSESSMSCFSHR